MPIYLIMKLCYIFVYLLFRNNSFWNVIFLNKIIPTSLAYFFFNSVANYTLES